MPRNVEHAQDIRRNLRGRPCTHQTVCQTLNSYFREILEVLFVQYSSRYIYSRHRKRGEYVIVHCALCVRCIFCRFHAAFTCLHFSHASLLYICVSKRVYKSSCATSLIFHFILLLLYSVSLCTIRCFPVLVFTHFRTFAVLTWGMFSQIEYEQLTSTLSNCHCRGAPPFVDLDECVFKAIRLTSGNARPLGPVPTCGRRYTSPLRYYSAGKPGLVVVFEHEASSVTKEMECPQSFHTSKGSFIICATLVSQEWRG